MKSNLLWSKLLVAVTAAGMAVMATAGSFTDNFNVNRDYTTAGLAGTPWQGLTPGLSNPGTIAAWNANLTAPNTLTITNTGGAWRNTGDGPFFWTLVKGDTDFTNTVRVSDMSQANFNMSGLLIRDPNTVNQNYVMLALFAEFNIALIYRDTIEGSDSDVAYTPPYHVEGDKATWANWLRIARNAGVISLSASTNGIEWEAVYTSLRTDLTNDLQVGIMNSTYSANENYAQFQNFSVEGPGVNTNVPPSQASGLTVAPAVNALNIAWTPGAGSAGSVVVVRQAAPITRQPVVGQTYNGNTTFGNGADLGQSNYVAYVGAGSSFTLTNVLPTIPYTVAVYSYSGAGDATVYALVNTPTATAAPFGSPTGISLSFTSTNAVAVDDTIQAIVKVQYAGGGEVDVTSSATFSSGNPSLATVTGTGLISGLGAGVVPITASYQTFNTTSNLTVVLLPVTDGFDTPRDYLANGIAGTPWHGLLLGTNDVPPGGVTFGPGKTLLANAGISKSGVLTVQSTDTGFDATENDGFHLYRVIAGDFSISVQIKSFNNAAFHMPGLMARRPFEETFAENSLAIVGFNEFNIGNFVRIVNSSTKAEVAQQVGQTARPFLKLERQTNTFNFYQKAHALDPWTLIHTEERPDLDGVPLQVGLVDQIFTTGLGVTEFDNLVITGSTINNPSAPAGGPSGLTVNSLQAGQVTATWTPAAGSAGSVVIAHFGTPVTRQPADGADYLATANADLSLGFDIGGSNVVIYTGTGNSVVASNFPPYLFGISVYAHSSVGGTNFYNILSPASGTVTVAGVPVINPPPPAQITRFVGANVSIASGASPANYNWLKDGTPLSNGGRISGATSPTLNIASTLVSDSGNYQFAATTIAGGVTSSPTVLTVIAPTNGMQQSVLAYGPIAFWPLDETTGTTAFDFVGGYNGTHGAFNTLGVAGPTPADGFPQFAADNLAVQLPGNGSGTAVQLPELSTALDAISNWTITAWIKPAVIPTDRAGVVVLGTSGLRLYGGGNGLSILWNNSIVSHTGLVPPVGQWSFVALAVSPTGARVYMATNGGWQVYQNSTAYGPINFTGLCYLGSDRNIAGRFFEGPMDEVAIYRSALSGAAITNLFNGIVPPPSVTVNIQKVGGGVQVSWPSGTLLESANVTGPWTTNSGTSPLVVPNPTGTRFYKVIVQ